MIDCDVLFDYFGGAIDLADAYFRPYVVARRAVEADLELYANALRLMDGAKNSPRFLYIKS